LSYQKKIVLYIVPISHWQKNPGSASWSRPPPKSSSFCSHTSYPSTSSKNLIKIRRQLSDCPANKPTHYDENITSLYYNKESNYNSCVFPSWRTIVSFPRWRLAWRFCDVLIKHCALL